MDKQADRKLGERRQELVELLPNIRRFALSLAGSMADADDLLQATVERLLQRGLPADAPLLPWCLKTCRNLWIDEVRSRGVRDRAKEDPDLAEEQAVAGERQALAELALTELQSAMEEMPAEQRAVLELVAVEGYGYREAAEILEIPIGTVMSRLARARKALAGTLAANDDALPSTGRRGRLQ